MNYSISSRPGRLIGLIFLVAIVLFMIPVVFFPSYLRGNNLVDRVRTDNERGNANGFPGRFSGDDEDGDDVVAGRGRGGKGRKGSGKTGGDRASSGKKKGIVGEEQLRQDSREEDDIGRGVTSHNLPCNQIDSQNACSNRKDCRAVLGSTCGSNLVQLVACVSNRECETTLRSPPELVADTDRHPDNIGWVCITEESESGDGDDASKKMFTKGKKAASAASAQVAIRDNFEPPVQRMGKAKELVQLHSEPAYPPNDVFHLHGSCIPRGYKRVSCRNCCDANPPPRTYIPLTIGVLFYHNHGIESLKHSVDSWRSKGLLKLADQVILFINGANDEELSAYQSFADVGIEIHNDKENIGIGRGIHKMVQASRNEAFLLLEKDFALVETIDTARFQLDAAKRRLMAEGHERIDAIRFRSRYNAGSPNCPPEKTIPPLDDLRNPVSVWSSMQDADGKSVWWEPHLFCNNIHFQDTVSIIDRYPDRAWVCGCNPEIICYDSLYCGWTNNPTLFRRQWFIDTMGPIAEKDCISEEWRKNGFCKIQFEFTSYYHPNWIQHHWVIGHVSPALFEHHELDE